MADLADFLSSMPIWKRYYTVDEIHKNAVNLSEEYREIELLNLGTSSNGESIDCLKVGDGRYKALIPGRPNCEEPIGGILLDFMARR